MNAKYYFFSAQEYEEKRRRYEVLLPVIIVALETLGHIYEKSDALHISSQSSPIHSRNPRRSERRGEPSANPRHPPRPAANPEAVGDPFLTLPSGVFASPLFLRATHMSPSSLEDIWHN